jgi:hypothetical protein
MRMAALSVTGVLGLVGLLSAQVEAQRSPAGYVKVVTGTAVITRAGVERPARPGDPIYENDGFRTGRSSSLGVTLKDDTRLSLGSNTEIDLSEFKFSPAQGQLGLVLKLLRGIAAFVSGRIEALRPDAVRLETPATIVGVRGTHLVFRAEGP